MLFWMLPGTPMLGNCQRSIATGQPRSTNAIARLSGVHEGYPLVIYRSY